MKVLKYIFPAISVIAFSFNTLCADPVHRPEGAMPHSPTEAEGMDPGVYVEAGLLLERMYFFNNLAGVNQVYHIGTGELIAPPITRESFEPINFNYDLEPGLTASVATYLGHDDWTLLANFDWMYAIDSINKQIDFLNVFYPTYATIKPTDYQTLKGTSKTTFFMLDVYVYKGAYRDSRIKFRPFSGIKTAWFFTYEETNFTDTGLAASDPAYYVIRSKTWGLGPMIGLDVNYPVLGSWSLYCDTNGSILLGHVNHRSTLWRDLTVAKTTTSEDANSYRYNETVYCPTMRATLGVQFDHKVIKDQLGVIFKVGFDSRYYFNQYALVKPVSSGDEKKIAITQGSFGMMGLVMTLGLDF